MTTHPNQITAFVFDVANTLHDERQLFHKELRQRPTLKEVLTRLQDSGTRLIIFADGGIAGAEWALNQVNLDDVFDHDDIFTTDELKGDKNKPATYERLAQIAGLAPASTAYFDDKRENVEAAQNAGFKGVHTNVAFIKAALAEYVPNGSGATAKAAGRGGQDRKRQRHKPKQR
ncbi:MAG: HAD family hydrolase [Alphaproteobacteria bacterium]|nr:HAD family hydrolase [Alphaproteobacteria bacterium]